MGFGFVSYDMSSGRAIVSVGVIAVASYGGAKAVLDASAGEVGLDEGLSGFDAYAVPSSCARDGNGIEESSKKRPLRRSASERYQ